MRVWKSAWIGYIVLALAGSGAAMAQAAKNQGAPLPNPSDLLQRAIANETKVAAERERYECRVNDETTELDSKGHVKKTKTVAKEKFFVNGVEVDRTLARNGIALTPDETKKEDDRVMKRTMKYNDPATAKNQTDKQDRQLEEILLAMQLTNGHRETMNGRNVLLYDIVPNPNFKAKNLNQRFAQVMQGKIVVDEKTGEPIDINIKSAQDLKIGGGLLADLHKGFWVHLHDHAEPDGVWLADLAEGSGDARAALFFHPYFRFKETTSDCRLYNATAQQVGQAKPTK